MSSSVNGERTPLPGQLRLSGRQGCVRSQYSRPLMLVLGDEAKESVRFVADSSGEIHAGAQREHVPQAVKLERRAIGAHECLDESACHRIVNVNESVTEIADPKFVIHDGESPWGIKIPL